MAFDLCTVPQASKPYYIENISSNIWSIEELCYYLYENICLIDSTICNEALCDWIRDELGLKKLYRTLYTHLEAQDGIVYFVIPIFREIGYLSPAALREFQEQLGRLEVQPEDNRRKLKGDYLVRCGMYSEAIRQYRQILRHQNPGALGAGFYSGIWNNLGAALARSYRFEEAASCFLEAWKLSHTKEMLRKYVSVLPLYLDDETYQSRLQDLGADPALIRRIQEYNAKMAAQAQEELAAVGQPGSDIPNPAEQLEALREDYRRRAKCIG